MKGAGMPQFDFVSSLIQIVAMFIAFGLILLVLLHVFMPKIAAVTKAREVLLKLVHSTVDGGKDLWNKILLFI